jgi:hypothetical protein
VIQLKRLVTIQLKRLVTIPGLAGNDSAAQTAGYDSTQTAVSFNSSG